MTLNMVANSNMPTFRLFSVEARAAAMLLYCQFLTIII